MIFERFRVDLRDHQRHAGIHAEVIAVIYHDTAALNSLPTILLGSAFAALGARKQRKVESFERIN